MSPKTGLMALASSLLLATPVTLVAAGPAQAETWACGPNNSLTCHSKPCNVGDTEYTDHCVSGLVRPGSAGRARVARPGDGRAVVKAPGGSTGGSGTAQPAPAGGASIPVDPAKPKP